MTVMRRFIEGMPKAELHVYVEGTLEPELKFELAVNAFEASWLPSQEKRALRGRLDRFVASPVDA